MDPSSQPSLPASEPENKLTEPKVKTETPVPASSPSTQQHFGPDSRSTSQQPIPSTETGETSGSMPLTSSSGLKKKGTATATKKAPKRANKGGPKKASKKTKPSGPPGSTPAPDDGEEEGGDDESDNGPYCLCRGADDHRWMICCEKCEDWFHGECINLSKEIGESLIERFICPNCTNESLTSIYKRTCALGGCRKPARLSQGERSVFCSNDHVQTWWERMVGRLPNGKANMGLNDSLTQNEFMTLLNSELSGFDNNGVFKLISNPFQNQSAKVQTKNGEGPKEDLSDILTEEEKSVLSGAENTRVRLVEETLLCHKMLTLIELAQERRKAVINSGRLGDDICGYDPRLDTISARDAFAAFAKSPEGEAMFKASKLTETESVCERKRCKVHSAWQKMLTLGVKYQIREMAGQAAEVTEGERIVRQAAGERWRRKKAESNYVEVLTG